MLATLPSTLQCSVRFGYDAFSLEEFTLGNVMQQAGYITSHFGKW
jgi:arylsulfatase A-like enzyme